MKPSTSSGLSMDNTKLIFVILISTAVCGLIVVSQLQISPILRHSGIKQQPGYANYTRELETNEAKSETHEEVRFSEEWWDRMKGTQHERKARLRKICRELYHKTPMSPAQMILKPSLMSKLVASHNYKLIYSIVYKVSSSSWSESFVTELERCEFHPQEEKMYNHTCLRYMNKFKDKDNMTACLERYKKFLIVRNPLARLVSVYKDKFIDYINSYYKELAQSIIKSYRIHDNETNIDNQTSDIMMRDRPTFVEFISYMVESDGNRNGNPHWDRVFDNNGVCEIEFDVIAKIEDAYDDYAYLTKTLGIWNVTRLGKGARVNINGDKQVREYFSKVPLDLLHKIYKAYEEDFILFDYDMPALFS